MPMTKARTRIEELDGSPTGLPYKLKFPNGTLTDNGDGTFTYTPAASVGETVVTITAGQFDYSGVNDAVSGATVSFVDDGETTLKFVNGVSMVANASCKVPFGCTSLSSIKIIYRRDHTGNLFCKFNSAKFKSSTATAVVTDRGNSTDAYAGGGNDGKYTQLSVPSTSFDGLGAVVANDVVGLFFQRSAGNASDTYEADWHVLGVQFTFA